MKKNTILLLVLLFTGSFLFAQNLSETSTRTSPPNFSSVSTARAICTGATANITNVADGTGIGVVSSITPNNANSSAISVDNVTLSNQFITDISVEGVFSAFSGTAYDPTDEYVLVVYGEVAGVPDFTNVLFTERFNALTVDPDLDAAFTLDPIGCPALDGQVWIGVHIEGTATTTPRWNWSESDDGDGVAYITSPVGDFGLTPGVFVQISPLLGRPIDYTFNLNLCEASITLVPTMTEWGLFLFGLVMVTIGLVFVYNKQRQLA